MIARKIVTDIQDGHIRTTEMELEAQMLLKMGQNQVVVVDGDDNLLFRFSVSQSGELQYESYDSLGNTWKQAVSLTPSLGNSIVSIYKTSGIFSSPSIVTGFNEQLSKGSNISFSLANQQLTLQPGDYVINAYTRFTASGSNGRVVLYPHDVNTSSATRLGSPQPLYEWDLKTVTNTNNESQGSGTHPIYLSVTSGPITLDIRADSLTNLSAFDFIQIVVQQLL